METREFNYNVAYTHAGVFHADDAFSAALCRIINPFIKVVRVFNVPDNLDDKSLVFDIGLGEFDHHQVDNESREDGTPYAAFGKLWRAFGHLVVEDQNAWEFVENSLVVAIDKHDNGVEFNPLSTAIKDMNPVFDSESSRDFCFELAVDFAKAALDAKIEQANASSRAKNVVAEAVENMKDNILVFKAYVPTFGCNLESAKAEIYPDLRSDGYVLGTIKNVSILPEYWLEKKPVGCTFVHKGRFIATFESIESAIEAASEVELI